MRKSCWLPATLALMTALTAAAHAESANEGNDLLCTRYGCAGGSLSGSANAYNDAAVAGNLSTLGVTAGLDAAAPVPLLQDYGIGAQLAMSDGYYNWSGHSSTPAQQGYERQQLFSLGLFRRPDATGAWWTRWGFGGTWDNMVDHAAGTAANNFTIRQIRLKASYDLTESHEVGIWRTFSGHTDHAGVSSLGTGSNGYRAVDQMNFFYKYHLPDGGHLQAYIGPGVGGTLASNANHLFRYTWGADMAVPVNNYLGVFGGVSFAKASVTPAFSVGASEASNWSLSTGLNLFWGGNARHREDSGKHWMPYLSDPDNGNFLTQQSSVLPPT